MKRNKILEALQALLPLARGVTTSPSAALDIATREDVTTVTVTDGGTRVLTVTLDGRARGLSRDPRQVEMFTADGRPAATAPTLPAPPCEPEPVTVPVPVSTKPARLTREADADRLAVPGKISIVGQETVGGPWEIVAAEVRFPDLASTWAAAVQAYVRVRLYNRGRRCTRDTRDEVAA